jgi:cytochrome c
MKAIVVALLAAGGVAVAGHAVADEALAKAKNCMSCHAVDKKVVGPAYRDVAAKYRGKGQEAMLVEKVIKGGKGVWGEIPMPPNPVTPDEAKKLVAWVLSRN